MNEFILINDVKVRMKYWTAFVLALKLEGFSIFLIEAMAMELPVLASNLEAIPEMIIDGKTGLLFEKNNYDDLSNKIILLLNDNNKIREFGKQGIDRVSKYFNISKTIHRYESIYYS